MRMSIFYRFAVLVGGLVALPMSASAAPIVFSASGANVAAIQATVDSFRAALGGSNNGNSPGALLSGRREINWDGGGNVFTTTTPATPFNVFLNTRGAQFVTPGTGLTQAPPSADLSAFPPGGLAGLFANPSYGSIFTTFSNERLFVPVGSNVTDGFFFIPGSSGAVAANISGFGAVFSDVDLAATTSIGLFRPNGDSLGQFFVSPFDNGLSFLGVLFDGGEMISRIRIITGNSSLGPNDGSGVDVVAMDDFIYSEPRLVQAVPLPASWVLLSTALAGLWWRRPKR